eukprot:GFUD01023802.1.p1 GENE.GFUD01023802.1~~GFUD01023802.1.p1  ORF type:complete len:133 (-),score=27.21 GFUD01023802.1:107-505(-)
MPQPTQHNVQHKSKADKRAKHIKSATAKLGGEIKANEILADWRNHRQAEGDSDRRKREADGFVRGLINGHSLTRLEASDFFNIGNYRWNRLKNLNPVTTRKIRKKIMLELAVMTTKKTLGILLTTKMVFSTF